MNKGEEDKEIKQENDSEYDTSYFSTDSCDEIVDSNERDSS